MELVARASVSRRPAVVIKLHHVDAQTDNGGKTKPDADPLRQTGNNIRVILAELHHLLTAPTCPGKSRTGVNTDVAG